MPATRDEAQRNGETLLALGGYVRGIGRNASIWTNHETGDLGRLCYYPNSAGEIVEVKFQRPAVDGTLPAQTSLIKY